MARREGFEPPTARSVGWCSTSTQWSRVLLVQLRSGAESSQTARVLSGSGWWTDTGTDIRAKRPAGGRCTHLLGEVYRRPAGAPVKQEGPSEQQPTSVRYSVRMVAIDCLLVPIETGSLEGLWLC